MAYNPDTSLYSGKSPLSAEYNRLFALLVPSEGRCATLEGEMLRASSRIYHDYYNNGFGNNWSGAHRFLDKHLGLRSSERKMLGRYARGRICKRSEGQYGSNDPIAIALEDIATRVVEWVLTVEKTGFNENNEDMFDYQEKSAW
jgi:hypothetical protein